MNANFTEVTESVNDNDARIAALEAELAELSALLQDCPTVDPTDEMVRVGSVCVDKYESSIWDAPVGGNQITGTIPCSPNGQDCDNIYARSVAGVEPRANITWFQTQAALVNAGKRLPTNAEWQSAVAGTPDTSDCNATTATTMSTGANPGCVSRFGVFDMIGNLWEWTGEWDEVAAGCENWPVDFGGDRSCIGRMDGDLDNHKPAVLIRGGARNDGAEAGPFAFEIEVEPSAQNPAIGFRGIR
jgi:formylglycine-generating enzyme required for sulfatase activity